MNGKMIIELYDYGDLDSAINTAKGVLSERFSLPGDDERLNCDKAFYMHRVSNLDGWYMAHIDLFENELFSGADNMRSLTKALAREYSWFRERYGIGMKWHGLSFNDLTEVCIGMNQDGSLKKPLCYSFLPAVKEYGIDDYPLFLSNLRVCVSGTAAEGIFWDFSQYRSLWEIFRENYDNKNDMLLINMYYWLESRFPQMH